ncbi:MAG: trigger factor [Lachnospirales bacterium]
MSNTLEKLEHNMVKISMEIPTEDFDKACDRAYQKEKNRITLPGFRKGKAPRKMIERFYGKEIFFEDALNDILPDVYMNAVKELELDVVSRPQIDVDKMEAGSPVVVTATVAVKPEVTLGEYKGVVAEKETVAVTEDDVEEELKKSAEKNARLVDVTDRPAEMGDEVIIDFDGYVDGKPFEGGKSEDYHLTLGSHSFVDTFEDQIVGKNAEEAFDVTVTFPENYHKDLAGKEAVFKVVLKKIQKKELPELDDDYAKDYSEFDTLAEYKEDLHKKLLETKQKEADDHRARAVLDAVIAGAQMDIPEAMVEDRVDSMIQNFSNNLRYQGINMDQYMQMTGSNMASLRASVRQDAEKSIKEALVLEAVVKAENLEVTDEDFDAEVQKLADLYKIEADKLKENISDSEKEGMLEEMKSKKAVEWLVANAKEA